MRTRLLLLLAALLPAPAAQAGREPVLPQVKLPHSYYWRELYLPQLTTGPSAAAFLPDGQGLVYSMEGSLWRQALGEDLATELTHPRGAYDHQPDVAPDGASVVFTRYDGAALELWRLDLRSGREQRLTSEGAVNVEPRIAPDGRRLAWVSTRGNGNFNLYVAELGPAGLSNVHALLGERRSAIDRYYYAPVDHAINPSWSPDGETLYYVANPEVAWGSGDVWAVPVADPAARRRVHAEETSWAARPELAPDGKRLLYSGYRGRQWHQLWLTTPRGVPPLPLSFGEFDRRYARWSPNGQRIAYVDNRDGGTALRVMDVIGGRTETVQAARRETLSPQGTLVLDIRDGAGQRVPARVSVTGSDGRAHAPAEAWLHADDGFDRATQATETHYFHCAPPCRLQLPTGAAQVTVRRGFETLPWSATVDVAPGLGKPVIARLQAQPLPTEYGEFVSADLHVHMNYGGHYRHTPETLVRQAEAEDLDIVHNLVVNKEERIPDIAAFRTGVDPASNAAVTLLQGQEYHTSFWGHLGLLQLRSHYLTPDFSAYRHTALASPYPHNGVIADLAHEQGALVGYVHPFDWDPDPAKETGLSHQLPADAMHRKADYIEVVGFSDHRATAGVWYRLLNLGLRVSAGAGTDAMANYASLRGPVGLNRVFLDTAGSRDPDTALAALRKGEGFASNGPLLGLLVDGRKPGAELPAGRHAFRLALRSPVPVQHLELVHNGRVVKAFDLKGDRRTLDAEGELELGDGWLLLRAWNEQADPGVLDLYPYATTNPVWIGSGRASENVRGDAAYFVAWLDRVIANARAREPDFNDAGEFGATLDYLRAARARYAALAAGSTE
ncbi:MAG: CehA/McbA family metallohydrolase [Rhizobium sp.]|nr:CehA/McbA family metallohydrolase [Rhizobium sp.]